MGIKSFILKEGGNILLKVAGGLLLFHITKLYINYVVKTDVLDPADQLKLINNSGDNQNIIHSLRENYAQNTAKTITTAIMLGSIREENLEADAFSFATVSGIIALGYF
jgi:hypothetical protein